MADLTETGLLCAAHLGRKIADDSGCGCSSHGLLQFGELSDDERGSISAALEASGAPGGHAVRRELDAVRPGRCAGLVLAPKSEGALRHIEFVPLGPGRALVVLVAADGHVENRVIETAAGSASVGAAAGRELR